MLEPLADRWKRLIFVRPCEQSQYGLISLGEQCATGVGLGARRLRLAGVLVGGRMRPLCRLSGRARVGSAAHCLQLGGELLLDARNGEVVAIGSLHGRRAHCLRVATELSTLRSRTLPRGGHVAQLFTVMEPPADLWKRLVPARPLERAYHRLLGIGEECTSNLEPRARKSRWCGGRARATSRLLCSKIR